MNPFLKNGFFWLRNFIPFLICLQFCPASRGRYYFFFNIHQIWQAYRGGGGKVDEQNIKRTKRVWHCNNVNENGYYNYMWLPICAIETKTDKSWYKLDNDFFSIIFNIFIYGYILLCNKTTMAIKQE